MTGLAVRARRHRDDFLALGIFDEARDPVMVPPVPTPDTKISIGAIGIVPRFPVPSSIHESRGFAGLSNCCSRNVFCWAPRRRFPRPWQSHRSYLEPHRSTPTCAVCEQKLATLHAHSVGHRQRERNFCAPPQRTPARWRCCRWSARRVFLAGTQQATLFGTHTIAAPMRHLTVGGVASLDLPSTVAGAPSVTRLSRTSGVWPIDCELSSYQFCHEGPPSRRALVIQRQLRRLRTNFYKPIWAAEKSGAVAPLSSDPNT